MEDIVAGIEAAVPAIEELEGAAKLFLLLRNTLVRPLNAAQIEELKAAFKMEFDGRHATDYLGKICRTTC